MKNLMMLRRAMKMKKSSFVALILMAFIFIGMFITKNTEKEEINRGNLW